MRDRFLFFLTVILSSVLINMSGASAQTGSDTLVLVRVGDVVCVDGQTDVLVPVYLESRQDAIGSFKLSLSLDRSDLGVFDELGELGYIQDYFDYIFSIYGPAPDLSMVVWEGNYQLGLGGDPIPAGEHDTPIFYSSFDAQDIDDSSEDRVIHVYASHYPGAFWLFDEFGHAIAPPGDSVVADTSYFICAAWLPGSPEVCLDWHPGTAEQHDSVYVYYDTFPVYADEGYVFQHGSITVVPPVCGNIDNSLDGVVDISDLTRYIDFLFLTFEPIDLVQLGDIDESHDGIVDIADLTRIINHLFISFEDLTCGT